MSRQTSTDASSAAAGRTGGPGRPKDPAKRAAILRAASRMFLEHGFEGTSMEQVATDAGVSKLTVYSHFGNKESLLTAAVAAHCEQALPPALLVRPPGTPLRPRLMEVGRAIHALVSSPEAVAAHRVMCSPPLAGTPLARLFWEAGPERVRDQLANLLRRRIATGELAIADSAVAVDRAAAQLMALLKGEPYAMQVIGCRGAADSDAAEAHIGACIDMFLRAYEATPATEPPCPRSR